MVKFDNEHSKEFINIQVERAQVTKESDDRASDNLEKDTLQKMGAIRALQPMDILGTEKTTRAKLQSTSLEDREVRLSVKNILHKLKPYFITF